MINLKARAWAGFYTLNVAQAWYRRAKDNGPCQPHGLHACTTCDPDAEGQ